ncbi:MAG TPA: MaoC family dehydratase [Candidatus Acidoferrales bacterium]|nr:MaoC family dehydratase [Candidatus Acidoferrales bacterium]
MGTEHRSSEIRVGQRASLSRTIGEADIRAFAELSGDRNPLHLDREFARRSRFGRTIAHGMLSAGIISAALGKCLPGPGAIYLSQTLRFVRPVYPGDTVTATVEITAYREEKGILTARTTCTNQTDAVVIDGEAVLLVERPSAAPAGPSS